MNSARNRFLLAVALVAFAVLARIVPHAWNFAPVGALALFAGACFERRGAALAMPLLATFVSDLALGHAFSPQKPLIYLSYVLIAMLGIALRDRRGSALAVGGASLAGSMIFFVLTNFGVWAFETMYPRTVEGLIACYVAALPFFGRTVASDLIFNAILFGVFVWTERALASRAVVE